MAFQRVDWQKLGPWALNLENLRHDIHHFGTERHHCGGSGGGSGSSADDGEEGRTSSKRLANLGRSHSTGSQKEPSWKRQANSSEYRQRSSPDSDLEEDMTDWAGFFPPKGASLRLVQYFSINLFPLTDSQCVCQYNHSILCVVSSLLGESELRQFLVPNLQFFKYFRGTLGWWRAIH